MPGINNVMPDLGIPPVLTQEIISRVAATRAFQASLEVPQIISDRMLAVVAQIGQAASSSASNGGPLLDVVA
jgi:hypothetical protein